MASRLKRDIFTGEIVEEHYEPSPNGRTVIFRGELPFGSATVQGKAGQTRAVRDDKPHISTSLGVPVAQVGRFNAELEKYGVSGARYSEETGMLKSTDDNSRHAAWAIRGYYNAEGGSNADKWANAIGY